MNAQTAITNSDDADSAWAVGIAAEWAADWADSSEDIYTLADGAPVFWDAPPDYTQGHHT